MGVEITYCFKCSRRIVGTEFTKGEAYQVGNNVTCAACAADLLGTLQGKERQQLLSLMFKRTNERKESAAGKPSSANRANKSTARIPAAGAAPPPRAQARSDSTGRQNPILPWLAAGVGGVIVLVGVLVFQGDRPSPDLDSRPARVALRSTPPPPPAPAPPSTPEPDPKSQQVREAVRKAQDYAGQHPEDFPGQNGLWEKAVRLAEGTPFNSDVKFELERLKVRRSQAIANWLASLDLETVPLLSNDSFKQFFDLLNAARPRDDSSDWTQAIDSRIDQARGSLTARFAMLRDAAVDAKRQNLDAEVRTAKERVRKWGLPEYESALDAALAAVRGPAVVFSEKFGGGAGKFGTAKVIAGAGMNGSAALEIKPSGVEVWNAFSVDPGAGSCVRFSAKPVGDVQFFCLLSWSNKANDNARTIVPLNKGEWKRVEIPLSSFRFGPAGEGGSYQGEPFNNMKMFCQGNGEIRVLLADFEICEAGSGK
ncbi:MAG TPA: hypothetical protein VMU54_12075 [Planctomycetota bacterium]|nr:hypothetical protein [Planctomycetota bacterium]